ncbi:PD40 domain-containing protein [Candidatus Poribacteria bacterium]|nr:PD40 domain-containing protein [Candidatus Poribacteria bacterium]
MKKRPDMQSEASPEGLEIVQLTTEEVPSSHIYMEAQIFTPDSKRFILHRSAHPHGSDPQDPEHQYLICDLENNCELIPITKETGATAPSVSPDGTTLYYFIDETHPGGGRLTLKRVGMDGTDRETLLTMDSPLPNTNFRPSRPYPLSTISSDGKRLAISTFFGDGNTTDAPWGLMVFDLEGASVELIIHGQTWCNMHPQYSRSLDTDEAHDILIQENHGNTCDSLGKVSQLVGGDGADIHVLRDDGTKLRDLPWGRDGIEFCQGHQCWIGRSSRALTSTSTREPKSCRLIEGQALPHVGHLGLNTPGGRRNDLSRDFPNPDFYHFATDIAGQRLITDAGPRDGGGAIYLAELPTDETGQLGNITFLLNPRSSWEKGSHIHPFLSPDGSTGFFNSDESGILQAYMVKGWAV